MLAPHSLIRVLVMEDEVIVGFALGEELKDLGAEVVITHDAQTAREHLVTSVFSVAIMDVALPGLRGDVFAKECRELFPQMPIVLSTGLDRRRIRDIFAEDRRVVVLEKPYEFAAMRECLEGLGIAL